MSFRLRKEWIDQEDGIQSVHLHYGISPLGEEASQSTSPEIELIPEQGHERRRRANVIESPRRALSFWMWLGEQLDPSHVLRFLYDARFLLQ